VQHQDARLRNVGDNTHELHAMKTILLTLILISNVSAFTTEKEIRTFGFYSDATSINGGPPVGYTLQLWKYKESLIGRLIYNEGLFGVSISGFIDNVKYNPEKNAIRFESNLNGAIVKFRGKLYSNNIVGNYTWPDRTNKNVSLMSCCLDDEINIDYNAFADWIKMWEQLK
jgi:hypothetical protein